MRFAGIVPLALLAWLAALAAPIGLADLTAFSPRQTFARPAQPFPAAADPAWTRGRDLLLQAIELDPLDPNHAEGIALWYERGGALLPPRSPDAAAYFLKSLEYFRRAAVLRPGSPYTWSNIGLVKLRLGEVDAELAQAVTNSTKFGPWEPEVQLAIADIVFAVGDRLPPSAQKAGLAAITNAMRYHSDKLYERAVLFGRLALLCSLPGAGLSKFAIRCI
jgi:tetratricopeptide (TPR) repeat protein